MAIDFEPLTDAPKIDFEPESSPAAPIAVAFEPDMPTSDAGPAPAPRAQEDLNFATAAEDTIDANIIGAIAGTADLLKDTFSIPGATAGRPSDQQDYDVLLNRRKQIESDLQSGNLNAAQVEGHARALEQLNYRIGQLANPPRSETFGGQLGQTAQAYRESAQRLPGAAGAIARGVGNVAAAVPLTIGTGGTGLALATAQQVGSAESAARTQTEQQLKAAGVPEKEAEAMAQFAGTEEALKAAVTMPAYLLGGKAASGATAALIGENASPLLRAAVGTVGATAANVGTGSAIRAIEGEPAAPTWETATQDVLWGIVHGAGEFAHASEAQKVRALDEIAKRKVAVVENQNITGEPNAITQQSSAQIHGDVLNPEGTSQSTGEVPPNESSPGVPPRGQGEIVARNAPSEAQPKIVSTAIDVGNGNFITGKEWNSPHAELTKEAIATNPEIVDDLMDQNSARRGFIVEDPNGQQRFVDRKEAYTIAGEAGQRAVENSKGELNSQDLQSPVAPEASVPAPPERNLGPGAANIEEFVPPPEIGAWNAKVDEQRAARGLPPLASEARKPDPVLWDTTMGKIEREVIKPEEIVNEVLSNKKKIATDEEQTALLYRMVDLHNKLDTEAQRYLDLSNNDAERAEAKLNYDRLEQEFQRTEEADRKVGTEQGRALRARRLIADENYNLVGIMRRLSMAKGEGKPITPEEVQKAKEGAAAVKTAADELEEVEAAPAVDESIRQIEEEAKKNPEFTPQVRSLADRISERLEKAAQAALSRLRGKLAGFGSAPDPTILADVVIYGASKIAKGLVKFGQWSTAMVKDFGEGVKPYLEDAWIGANKHIDDRVNASTAPKQRAAVKEAITKEKTVATADTITEEMKGKKPDELRSSVHKLMETLVRSGVKGRDALVDAVHERLKTVDPSISRRQTMDLMSGYGNLKKLNPDAMKAEVRDIKQQLQLVAKIQDVLAKIPLKKSGVERQALSDESRRLTQELNENIRKLGVVVSDPTTQLKTILAAQETRLTNRIKDLKAEIEAGERRVKTKTQAPTNEKIEALKKELAEVEAEHEKVLGKDEQRKINAILTSLKKRTADLQAKAAAGDFTKSPPRKASPITPEILKARAKLEDAKTVIDRGIEKERLKNRTFLEKSADLLAKWTRASILSGPITLAKLTTAAAYRVASIPAEEVAGSALKKLFPRAAARAPYEGRGLEPKLEAQSIAKGVTRGLMDAWNTVKSGKGQLDTALGKRDIAPRSLLDIFGAIHGALKAPVKRVFFERSMAKRVRSAAEAGVDVTDPAIQVQIAADAYKDAQRSIFMQDNKVASLVSQTAARLEAPNKNTGRPSTLGKAGATALRIALPVVKVPTNIVAEIFQHVFGLPYGLGKLAREYARGIEKLHPDEADAIFRSMKKGSLGTAMLLYGFFAPNQFGGQYAPGLKKKENEAGFGEMKVGGAKVPKFLIHNPLLETAQVGATIRHVMDQKVKGKTQGLMTGIGRGLLGAVEEAPQFDEAVRLSHLTEQNGPTKYFGELARSVAIPQLVQQIARWTDAQKRKPETIIDYLKEGIPGARETLPVRR